MTDIAELVKKRQMVRGWLDAQEKNFSDYCKPYREQIEGLDAQITAAMTEQGIRSLKTDTGTAILSTIVTPKVIDKIAFLDWVLADWDNRGEMLQIGTPLKETITSYMDAHEGQLPPNIETTSMVRFSIRKA
jgi:hypothetical protein